MNFKSLISSDNKNLSLGRTVFWIVLPFMLVYWGYFYPFMDKDAPDSLVTVFISILGYNLGKKFVPYNKDRKDVDNKII